MGNFILASILLAFVIIFTAVNSFIVCGICDDITAYIDSGENEKAFELWNNKRKYISVFVRDAELDVVQAHVEKLTSETPLEDGEAESALLAFRDAVSEVYHSEYPTFYNVF